MPRLLVAIGQRATSPPRLLRDLVCVLVLPLGDHSRVFIHYAISPAGAEAYEGLVVLVLVDNLEESHRTRTVEKYPFIFRQFSRTI